MLEFWLSIGIVLICLLAAIDIYWILNGSQIDIIRRIFARWVINRNHRIDSYVKGLRRLAEDE